ncbi:MAG: hypothetical protein HQ552_02300 [Desulfobacteraceae bacterium]|nr:hypothetical protein [Desulfobacteraceae bacterium]
MGFIFWKVQGSQELPCILDDGILLRQAVQQISHFRFQIKKFFVVHEIRNYRRPVQLRTYEGRCGSVVCLITIQSEGIWGTGCGMPDV